MLFDDEQRAGAGGPADAAERLFASVANARESYPVLAPSRGQ